MDRDVVVSVLVAILLYVIGIMFGVALTFVLAVVIYDLALVHVFGWLGLYINRTVAIVVIAVMIVLLHIATYTAKMGDGQ